MSRSTAGHERMEISVSGGLYGLDMDRSQSNSTTRSVSLLKVSVRISSVVGAQRSVTCSSLLSQPPPRLPAMLDLHGLRQPGRSGTSSSQSCPCSGRLQTARSVHSPVFELSGFEPRLAKVKHKTSNKLVKMQSLVTPVVFNLKQTSLVFPVEKLFEKNCPSNHGCFSECTVFLNLGRASFSCCFSHSVFLSGGNDSKKGKRVGTTECRHGIQKKNYFF